MNNNLREEIEKIINMHYPAGFERALAIEQTTNELCSLLYSHLLKKLPKEIDYIENTDYVKNGELEKDRYNQRKDAHNQLLSEIKQILKKELKGK